MSNQLEQFYYFIKKFYDAAFTTRETVKVLILLVLVSTVSCFSKNNQTQNSGNQEAFNSSEASALASENVQIIAGMSQNEVEGLLGAPSLVAKDNEQRETWVYEKVASNCDNSSEAPSVLAVHGFLPRDPKEFNIALPSQKPVSVRIRFNIDSKVDSFSYFTAKH